MTPPLRRMGGVDSVPFDKLRAGPSTGSGQALRGLRTGSPRTGATNGWVRRVMRVGGRLGVLGLLALFGEAFVLEHAGVFFLEAACDGAEGAAAVAFGRLAQVGVAEGAEGA